MNLRNSLEGQSRELLKKVELQTEPIDIDTNFQELDDIERFSNELYLLLTLLVTGEALAIVDNTDGNGLEAWRRLAKEYDPETPQNLEDLLSSLIQPARVKTLEQITPALNLWDVK